MRQQLPRKFLQTFRITDPARRRRGIKRLVQLRAEASHLRAVAAHLALRPRRSQRLQWKQDNAKSIQETGGPWYTLILYGEDVYWNNGGPSLAGHNIVIYPLRLPASTT